MLQLLPLPAQGALADTALQAANDLSDLKDVATARANLGVDITGTDNSTDVSLAGSLDYLSLTDQTITLGQVMLALISLDCLM